MSRGTAVDEHGRPIVAELGRAETPEEIAERKAAASARRRGSQTVLNLLGAVLASFAIVAFLVLVVVRPDAQPLFSADGVDVAAVAADAQGSVDTPLVVPDLAEGWYANRARIETGSDGVMSWQLGIITADDGYLSVVQGIDANASWVADAVLDARSDDTVVIGGLRWTAYDRRHVDDPGNMAYALVTESGASTVVLGGTAGDDEFRVLAEAVAAELEP